MTKPIVWTIAGTDPSGGAGIQADLKTMNRMGVHGCSVITAVIAQNTQEVQAIQPVTPEMIKNQLRALNEDVPPVAIKLGMLAHADIVEAVASMLGQTDAFIVCDPVLASSSSTPLLDGKGIECLKSRLLPQVDLVTPNTQEAEVLTGETIDSADDVERAARRMLEMGAGAVLLKGGHLTGNTSADYFLDGSVSTWIVSNRLKTPATHGTGCTLSSAIASARALGYPLLDAAIIAKAYVNQGMRQGSGVGKGRQPLAYEGWPLSPQDLPWISDNPTDSGSTLHFPDCGHRPLGIYPLVDSPEWVARCAQAGITTIQLRIKNFSDADRNTAIQNSVRMARECNCRLFINDFWESAIRFGAYGVHLGQEDLDGADLRTVEKAGLRLGTSTHSYSELARVRAINPSYIAIGTLFPSKSKPGLKQTLGLPQFRTLTAISPAPVVAIGGITVERADDVIAAGANGIAVISDIRDAADPDKRMEDWLACRMERTHPDFRK